jgi:hypothetical protein
VGKLVDGAMENIDMVALHNHESLSELVGRGVVYTDWRLMGYCVGRWLIVLVDRFRFVDGF